MGYTHYWYRPKELDTARWSVFTGLVRKLVANMPEHSLGGGGFYADKPLAIHDLVIDGEVVRFEGGVDEHDEMAHETFVVVRVMANEQEPLSMEFCKTARKPYDLLVCGCLIALKLVWGNEVKVTTDGGREEWSPAAGWVNGVFGGLLLWQTDQDSSGEVAISASWSCGAAQEGGAK